jgi:hypothetical protein
VISHPRRAALRALVAIVAGAVLLLLAPLDSGALRVGPLSLLWWYAVVAAPLGAIALAAAALVAARP